jgi:esterase/lipase superfamily enzyme
MTTTVYFATNRIANHPADWYGSYTFSMVAPTNPLQVTYGTAFVDSANLDPDSDAVGTIRSLQDLQKGNFSTAAFEDLAEGGRNILVFIHGFANSFADALSRAAFNREWFAACGVGDADTAVVAFSWPSRGQLLTIPFPFLPYREDRKAAGGSGLHLMRFFSNLLPILQKARENGRRTFLLTHSMGNLALQGAIQAWFDNGQGAAEMFDEVFMAAADIDDNAFDAEATNSLAPLCQIAKRISILYNRNDKVLDILSENINNRTRLGQHGPLGLNDAALFPPDVYRMIDCSGFTDYDSNSFQNSHQYYRRSPDVRAAIAALMTP